MGTKVSRGRRKRDPSPGPVNPFDYLPDELLRAVLCRGQRQAKVEDAVRLAAGPQQETVECCKCIPWAEIMMLSPLRDRCYYVWERVHTSGQPMTVIILAGCKHLTDMCYQSLAHFTQLRRLGLEHCSQIGDVTLQNAVACMPHLTHVNLTMCRRITDYGVGLLGLLEDLEVLSIAFCTLVTDRALESLALGGTLQQLNAAHCPLITSHGVQRLVEGCPRMSALNVLGCPEVASDPSTVTYLVGKQGLKLVMSLRH